MSGDPIYEKVLRFAEELDKRRPAYTMEVARPEAVMFTVVVPGEHWEIEFMKDGTVEIERYVSDGEILDEATLADLWAYLE